MMPSFSHRAPLVLLACALSLNPLPPCYGADSGADAGKSAASDAAPAKHGQTGKKKAYVNESQDRVIKKKAFKLQNMAQSIAAPNPELGFFAIVPFEKRADSAYLESLLGNDMVSGLSVSFSWAEIEPSEDKFNFEPIDSIIAACKNHHKTVILRIASASCQNKEDGTPKWVLDSGVKTVNYTADGAQHPMPLFWDKTYLASWSNFVTELASHLDKNDTVQSIGITGGGFGIGTSIVPPGMTAQADESGKAGTKPANVKDTLKQQYGMTQRQIVEHWKYVADLFPKQFKNARLNFMVNAPVKGKEGEDCLDEIGDYLVYRFGQRIYLTRGEVKGSKLGFNDFRLLLKFHKDTLTGIRLADDIDAKNIAKISKDALDDGVSYAELPASILTSNDDALKQALASWRAHIGYELVEQKASIPDKVSAGEPLNASFEFVNLGAAGAMRPERTIEKDSPMSYRIQIELRNQDGKTVLLNVHTPPAWTSSWEAGKPYAWEQQLKMVDGDKHQLPPGQYGVFLSVVDTNQKRKLQFLHATSDGKLASDDTVEIGKLTVASTVADSKAEAVPGGAQEQGKH